MDLDHRQLERAKGVQKDLAAGKFIKPGHQFIGGAATALYKAEERRSAIIRQCAQEWGKVMGVPEDKFWHRCIPQAMFDLFDNYENAASALAAEAFLESLGYTITRPTFEETSA